MIFGFFRKKRPKSLRRVYEERLLEVENFIRQLEEELYHLKKERDRLRSKLASTSDPEERELLRNRISDLSKRIMETKKAIKLYQEQLIKLRNESDYMSIIVKMDNLRRLIESNYYIMSERMRPKAERVARGLEELIIKAKSEKLPDLNSDVLMKAYLGGTPEVAEPEEEPLQEPEPFPVAAGAVKQYSIEELAEDVYKVIELYIKFGKKDLLSVKRIALHLKVSEEDVKKALEYLERQGRIKIRRKEP